MFIKKLSALLALAFCATHAAAKYMKTVDASDYALKSYNAAVNKPLQVKPNTVYTVDKGSDTGEVDYSIIIQCPQPKQQKPRSHERRRRGRTRRKRGRAGGGLGGRKG